MKTTQIGDALEEIRAGRMLLILDDADRENEGDLFVAAERVTPEHINFMVTHGRGIVCMPLTEDRAAALGIVPMVADKQNRERERCRFGVSIDALQGITTGISAQDRATTIRKAMQPAAQPSDFRRPGHVFPLIARDGGVLVRRGHTEAAADLTRLAGLAPGGVICEVLNEDGTAAHGADLAEFAERHHLALVSIADIARYRAQHELLLQHAAAADLPTIHGQFTLHAYTNTLTKSEEYALVKGDVAGESVLVRVHSACFTGEAFGSLRCDCDEQLQTALCAIEKAGAGILIYLQQEGRGIGPLNKLRAYKLQDEGLDTVEANTALGFAADAREYWVAAQILRALGVHSVKLMSNNPRKAEALAALGITVTERLPLESMPTRHNIQYLETKRLKMGHTLDVNEKLLFL